MGDHLDRFAEVSQQSKEYQGHGWGCAWLQNGAWRIYRNIKPIWEDTDRPRGRTTLVLAHARSAFRDEGIAIENNMPFADDSHVFIFNGELQGVRIKEQGRIGAEKIFNYIKRFNKGDMLNALTRAVDVISKRTRYVRALNILIADRHETLLASSYGEDPDYFQLRAKQQGDMTLVCSQPYPDENDWTRIENHTITRIQSAQGHH
ncbi:MAG: hypothetical protein P8M18_03295 [Woeseiaceae bacterium]|nr:hypothetical protein [Woeseiaceae bacterium]